MPHCSGLKKDITHYCLCLGYPNLNRTKESVNFLVDFFLPFVEKWAIPSLFNLTRMQE